MTRLSIIIILSFLFSYSYAGSFEESYKINVIHSCKQKFLSGDPRIPKLFNIDSLCKCYALGLVNSLSKDELVLLSNLDLDGITRFYPRFLGTMEKITINCSKKSRK
tara:strand:- start:584 stop:904 length:321 start_codon:yes stop_codon:yes gene_type:complete